MSSPTIRPSLARVSILCVVLVISQSFAQQQKAAPKQSLPMDAVDSLTAPIALYPDALVSANSDGCNKCEGTAVVLRVAVNEQQPERE